MLRLILWPAISQLVRHVVGHHFDSRDHISIFLCLTITFFLIHAGRTPWREDGLELGVQSLNGPSRAEPLTILCCLIWYSPNLEGQVSIHISPGKGVAQLYPCALDSHFAASYDSRGYGGDILTRLHTWGKKSKSSQSYVTTYGQSISTSWCTAYCGTCDEILILSESCCLVSVGRPLWRGVECLLAVTVSSIFPLSNIISFFNFICHKFYVQIIYTRPQSAQAQYSRSCPKICSLLYDSSLNTWTVLRLTATKFIPIVLSV
jgi:hypothetical protein